MEIFLLHPQTKNPRFLVPCRNLPSTILPNLVSHTLLLVPDDHDNHASSGGSSHYWISIQSLSEFI